MSLGLYLTFFAATVAFMCIPGPNVALIVSTSLSQGWRHGVITVLGAASAMVPQLILVVLGMVWLTDIIGEGMTVLRWVGAGYLVYLGLRHWRDSTRIQDEAAMPLPRRRSGSYWRGFVVSAFNPKVLLFYGAFFPQFVSPTAPALPQLVLLSVTFVGVSLVIDSSWAILAAKLAPLIKGRAKIRLRLTGSILIAAGFGLALARRSS